MTHPAAVNERYMRRALELAAHGRGFVSPNPMVGAVIVGPGDRIIGEGYHRRYGGPHAEVNAVNSVSAADRPLLGRSTIYVTLEPCSHFGKTPPCALLLKEIGIGRVVVGSPDPNPLVAGRGVAMLRQAGIKVVEGMLRQECMALNEVFMSAQIRRRPFVTLKWAQSADGYMDCQRAPGESAARFSTPVTSAIVHWRRSCADAIAVGAGTVLSDNPRLDVRLIHGRSPRPVVFDRHCLLSGSDYVLSDESRSTVHLCGDENLEEQLKRLFAEHSISSLLVEGGARLLESFISQGLWDRAFV
ncbi:MAG: bifunctional diaminohydroxyphosphoribosylaminopyrimidine deaminase/5-amino-6-(5-phosphoribosylamino)uracil reductase RibD, partial [Muribaculaceae bacterium]|nr:bifunctional diaminohydroxyphosphoribosylaminopyrimidine deaminase/5-amino-6-(5-phosphoribosylamino)uracil reductase RibD [Muribaculaceae bacterium]